MPGSYLDDGRVLRSSGDTEGTLGALTLMTVAS